MASKIQVTGREVKINARQNSYQSEDGKTITVNTSSNNGTVDNFSSSYGKAGTNSYWLGKSGEAEKHTHVFSEPVGQVYIDWGAFDAGKVTISINGEQINLNDLIAKDEARWVVLDGTGGAKIDGDGKLIDAGGAPDANNSMTGHTGRLFLAPKGGIKSLGVFVNGDFGGIIYELMADNRIAPCFVRGTLIRTDKGEVAVEELKAGDMVETLDHGLQPIRWIGSAKRVAVGQKAPVLIKKGAMGNDRDLRVSPQHRMLVTGWRAEMLFAQESVLVAAQHLVNDKDIIREIGGEVEYFHILFDGHEVVYAEGAPSESFHPGDESLDALTSDQAREIFSLFPELETAPGQYGATAYPTLRAVEARALSREIA